MKNKVYSKINQVPTGHAGNKLTDACLVLEGGALRGLYSAGVCDSFLENNLNFKYVVGTSAGSLIGTNYVAGNIGRSARVNLNHRFDKRYIGFREAIRNKGLFGFDFILDTYNSIEPMDYDSLNNKNRRLVACVTCLETGKTEYFENQKCSNFFEALKASSSMPFFSLPVTIDNKHYLDGGVSCKVPYKWALDNNFKKIIVLRTQHHEYRKKISKPSKKNELLFKKYPNFIPILNNMNKIYNDDIEEMEKLNKEGRILMLNPSEPITISRVEKDIEKLGDLYFKGCEDGLKFIDKIKEYLGE